MILPRAASGRPFFMSLWTIPIPMLRSLGSRAPSAAAAVILAGCAAVPQPRHGADAEGWQDVALPGKTQTGYR